MTFLKIEKWHKNVTHTKKHSIASVPSQFSCRSDQGVMSLLTTHYSGISLPLPLFVFVFIFIFEELWSDVVCTVYMFDKYKKYYCVSHWVTSHYTTIAISSLFFFSFFPFLFFFIFLYYKNLKVKNGFQPANCNLCQNCFTILN